MMFISYFGGDGKDYTVDVAPTHERSPRNGHIGIYKNNDRFSSR